MVRRSGRLVLVSDVFWSPARGRSDREEFIHAEGSGGRSAGRRHLHVDSARRNAWLLGRAQVSGGGRRTRNDGAEKWSAWLSGRAED